jgi:hypothetical protein
MCVLRCHCLHFVCLSKKMMLMPFCLCSMCLSRKMKSTIAYALCAHLCYVYLSKKEGDINATITNILWLIICVCLCIVSCWHLFVNAWDAITRTCWHFLIDIPSLTVPIPNAPSLQVDGPSSKLMVDWVASLTNWVFVCTLCPRCHC